MTILRQCFEDNKYFQEVKRYSSSCYMSLLNRFRFMEFKKDKLIVKKRSNNDSYFIVLSGVIEVVDYQEIKVNCKEKNKEKDSSDKKKQKQFRTVVLKTYQKGDSFGELGCIFGSQSMVNIVSSTDSCVAILSKDDYKVIQYEQDLMKLQNRLELLKMNSLFRCFSDFVILYFSYIFKTRIFNTGDTVYKENDPAENLYMIIKGDFKLLKKEVIKHDDSYQTFMDGQNQDHVEKQLKNLNCRKFRKEIQVAIIQNYQIFGEEFIFNIKNRSFTVRCQSQESEVVIIHKDQFIQKLKEFNYSIEFIRKHFQSQMDSRMNRVMNMKEDFYSQNLDEILKIQKEIDKQEKKQQQKYLNDNQENKYVTMNYPNKEEEENQQASLFMTQFDHLDQKQGHSIANNTHRQIQIQKPQERQRSADVTRKIDDDKGLIIKRQYSQQRKKTDCISSRQRTKIDLEGDQFINLEIETMNLLKKYYNNNKDDFQLFTLENKEKRNFINETALERQLNFRLAKKNIKNDKGDAVRLDSGIKPMSQFNILLSKLKKNNVSGNWRDNKIQLMKKEHRSIQRNVITR